MVLPVNSALCVAITLIIFNRPVVYSPVPRGTCPNCCPIQEREDINFFLYTASNPREPEKLILSDMRVLKQSKLNMSAPLVIYIHGFLENVTVKRGESTKEISNVFMSIGGYNVILVDWSKISAGPWYTSAVRNIPKVGRYVARFIRFLVKSGFLLEKIHLIGFSLGAEVAGYAGRQLREWQILLNRLTALDPAYPLFDPGSPYQNLGILSAKFVDVIHTDGSVFGNLRALGHADFYPNNGIPLQPGCDEQKPLRTGFVEYIIGCSHNRAWLYFTESVLNPKAFRANYCQKSENCKFDECCRQNITAYMGIAADSRLRGKFFLKTNDASPFGRSYL